VTARFPTHLQKKAWDDILEKLIKQSEFTTQMNKR
jgi:hypothetical protein